MILRAAPRRLSGTFAPVLGATFSLCFLCAPQAAQALDLFTINGFTGPFVDSNWTFTSGTGGTKNNTGVNLILTGPTGPASGTTAQKTLTYSFNTSQLLNPVYGLDPRTTDGQFSFDWSYLSQEPVPGADPFRVQVGSTVTDLSPFNYPAGGGQNIPITGSSSFQLAQGDTFSFQIFNFAGNAVAPTVTISNFRYTGSAFVPAPLPIFGAAAALAWSTALRRRIRMSASAGQVRF